MEKKISVAFNCCYGAGFEKRTYLPMLERWGEQLEFCYGIGFQRGYHFTNEPIDHMILTKIPTRVNRYIFHHFCRLMHKPMFYPYMWQGELLDYMVAQRMKADKSDIFFTRASMTRCIDTAKKMGKRLVILASSSEPVRQYDRYVSECDKFDVKHRAVYGNEHFRDTCDYGYKRADNIITISNVSNKTYLDGGYGVSILKMIPLTGTSFHVDEGICIESKQKAFISTAVHSMIKGTHRLLLAWKKAGIKDIPLVIAGSLHEDMEEFVSRYGPFENVVFTGYQGNLEKFYNDYDAVGILMSFSEAAGRTTPELMSKGFPMIVSPDATCDIVVDGVTGYVIEPTEEDVLASRLAWFAEDWERVYALRKNVFKAVRDRRSSDFGVEVAEYIMGL